MQVMQCNLVMIMMGQYDDIYHRMTFLETFKASVLRIGP